MDVEDNALAKSDAEFRGELVYFIVVDRFCDGDPDNNVGENPNLFDATKNDWRKYWGGDLQGVIDKLDYLKGLGVTAVWLTPLFEQVEGLAFNAAPVHGYWAKDFKRINPRWVKDADDARLFSHDDTTFDRLIAGLHERGMRMVLDVVCNHSSPDANGVKGQIFDDGKLIADFNDDKNNWYHHYGPVQDWSNEWQVQNCELAGLAKFNENNTDYRSYIKGAIKMWLDKGVDALRIDTVKHMPTWFWQEFSSDMHAHKPDVFLFGEWIYANPSIEKSLEFANHTGISMLDFGFAVAVRDALGSNDARGFGLLDDIIAQDPKYRCATELVTFFDNHDMPRFGSLNGDPAALRLATVLLLMSRGIPCLFYGTEQSLHNDTDNGNDPYNRPMMERFDTDAPLYKEIAALSKVRRENIAVQFGGQRQHYVSADVYAFTRRYREARAFVVVNRGGATVVDRIETELVDGTYTCVLSGRTVPIEGGAVRGLELGEKDAIVLSAPCPPTKGKVIARVQINGYRSSPGQTLALIGDAPELGGWDVAKAIRLEYIHENLWQIGIPFDESAGKVVSYKFVVLDDGTGNFVPARENRTSRRRLVPTGGVTKWRDTWGD